VKKLRSLGLVGAVAAVSSMPATGSRVGAAHYCGLEDLSHTVNTICNNYHDPKAELQYVVCLATGECSIS
jgi:hypothetical protein